MYTYAYSYIHTHTYIIKYMYMYTYMHTYTYVYMFFTYICIHIRIYIRYMYVYTYIAESRILCHVCTGLNTRPHCRRCLQHVRKRWRGITGGGVARQSIVTWYDMIYKHNLIYWFHDLIYEDNDIGSSNFYGGPQDWALSIIMLNPHTR